MKCLGREHAKRLGFWAVAHLYSCTAGTFFWLQCRPTALCSDERARSSGISRGSTQGSTRCALCPCTPTFSLSLVPLLITYHLEGCPVPGYPRTAKTLLLLQLASTLPFAAHALERCPALTCSPSWWPTPPPPPQAYVRRLVLGQMAAPRRCSHTQCLVGAGHRVSAQGKCQTWLQQCGKCAKRVSCRMS